MIFLLLGCVINVEAQNAITNPSFENDLNGYGFDGKKDCSVVTSIAQSGSKSLHCKITDGSNQGTPYQLVSKSKLLLNFNYELSAYVRMNKCSNKILMYLESNDYRSAVYVYSDKTDNCKNNDCWNSWNKISATSASTFKNASRYAFGFRVEGKGTCEFYIDNIQLTPIVENVSILRSVEIEAWRHEVYKEKVSVFVDLVIKETHWEKGNDMEIYVEIIDEKTGNVKLKLTKWKLIIREENYVALFTLNPRKLKPGYYDAKATLKNTFLNNKIETASTSFHVLDKKREYGIYIDRHRRVIDHGKPFFPLGLMCGDCELDYFSKYFADSPFNLIKLGGTHTAAQIEKYYEKGNRKLRLLDSGYQPYVLNYYGIKNETKNKIVEDALKKYINNIKNSPAFFGYYTVDEVSTGYVPRMKMNARIARETDYDHPLWGVLNQRLEMHKYKEGLDCYGTDIYPGNHFDDLRAVYTVTIQGRNRVVNNLANWGVPQFFDWTIYNKNNESPPSKQQMYQTMYQMLVGGANGIIWFDFHEMTKTKVDWKPYWNDLKDITYNFKEKFMPIFLTDKDPDPAYDRNKTWVDEVNQGRPCGLRFFRYNKKDYVLAVNPWRSQDKRCKFDVPHAAKDFKILEGNSNITRINDTLILYMPKMDVTWLQATNDKYPYDEGNARLGKIAGTVVILLIIIIVIVFAICVFIKKGKKKERTKLFAGL